MERRTDAGGPGKDTGVWGAVVTLQDGVEGLEDVRKLDSSGQILQGCVYLVNFHRFCGALN